MGGFSAESATSEDIRLRRPSFSFRRARPTSRARGGMNSGRSIRPVVTRTQALDVSTRVYRTATVCWIPAPPRLPTLSRLAPPCETGCPNVFATRKGPHLRVDHRVETCLHRRRRALPGAASSTCVLSRGLSSRRAAAMHSAVERKPASLLVSVCDTRPATRTLLGFVPEFIPRSSPGSSLISSPHHSRHRSFSRSAPVSCRARRSSRRPGRTSRCARPGRTRGARESTGCSVHPPRPVPRGGR